MPEKKIATFGSKPIRSGASTVAPNIATTCCRPTRMVGPVGEPLLGQDHAFALDRPNDEIAVRHVSLPREFSSQPESVRLGMMGVKLTRRVVHS